jgi:hypothetical protein
MDPDPESPKTWGSGSRSGSPTLVDTYLYGAAGTGGGSEEVLLQHGVCRGTNVTRPALG